MLAVCQVREGKNSKVFLVYINFSKWSGRERLTIIKIKSGSLTRPMKRTGNIFAPNLKLQPESSLGLLDASLSGVLMQTRAVAISFFPCSSVLQSVASGLLTVPAVMWRVRFLYI